MGFDNDCILNIQSLAGEYFCPVCRLLVYPNEALQTQCTHLYCKPCLTYVVSTTRACPYDGYLVTEADSKPLTESNQALAEMIGKISVHCLFHRSGCTWQGSLSDCITHCSECAFGNSLVACNRCSIQILHRQVQEHAQTCTGVQSQVQQANAVLENAATATEVASNPTQATTQAGTATSQSQPSQTIAMTVKDSCEQANANSQAQAVVQTSLSTHAQWYQQQQYQQYYQQYPGYDPYQQSYPYHQQAFGQHLQHFQAHIAQVGQQQPSQPYLQAKTQPQGLAGQQLQPKAEPQPQPQPSQGPAQQQLHPQAQPQSQGPSQQQLQSQAQPQSQSQLPFPVQTHMTSQTQVQANQQQQPQPAAQAQSQLLPQAHPISLTQKQPYPQGQPHSALPPVQHPQMPHYQQPYPQMQVSQPAVHYLSQQHHLRPQSQPHLPAPPQPYPSLQPQTQHPSSHAVTNNQPYQQVLPQNQIQQQLQLTATYQQPLQVHVQGPHQLQFPQPPQTHPSVQSQTPIYQQHQAPVPSHGQASIALPAQMQQIQPNLQQVGPPIQHRPNMHPVVQPTPLVQNQSFGGQLSGQQQQLQQSMQGPSHTFQQTHGYAHSQLTASSHSVQHHQSHNVGARPVNPTHKQSQPHVQSASVLQARQVQIGTNGTSASDKTEPNVSDAGSGIEPDKSKFVKSKTDLQSLGDDSKPIGLVEDKSAYISTSTKDITESESHLEKNGIPLNKQMLKEETVGSSFDQSDGHKFDEVFSDSQKKIAEKKGDETNKFQKAANAMVEGNQSQMPEHPHIQAKGAAQSAHQVMDADRRTHQLSTHHEAWTLHQQSAASSGFQSPSGHHGLQGHGHFPHHRHQPYGPETPSGPDAFIIGKGPSRSGHPSALQGPCEANPPLGQLHRPSNNDHRRPYLQHSASAGQWPFGQPSDIHGSMSGGIWPPASETVHDHMNPLHMDPGQRRFGDDINRSLRPSHLYTDHVSKIGRHFPSSRSLGGVPHGVGDIAPKPLNSERLGHISDRRHSPGAALHPYCLGSSEGGVYPTGLINDTTGRLNLSHAHPDFQGPIPGHGRRHMDGRLSRISPREHLGISRGFEGLPGGPGRNFGLEDMEIRAVRQFHEPLGNSVYAERFPLLPSGERQSEFDGLGDLRMDEQFRDHARFGDFPGNPRFRSFPDHLPPPGELFGGNRPNHPKPGEPGFRSSFILQGDMDPFDDLRKRKPGISMGWCRICKVDCETVEGLDIHSQTREHQNMAMDMVRSIKQNAKKRKLISSNHSVDASMSGNVKSEGRKSKN